MSQWTHVVGCIRVDGIPGMGDGRTLDSIKAILGPEDLFDAPNEDCTLPTGSEGSLQYRIVEYDSGMRWLAITIWGDLRSYDSIDEIEEWFKTTLKKIDWIRDAVLRVEVSGVECAVLLATRGSFSRVPIPLPPVVE